VTLNFQVSIPVIHRAGGEMIRGKRSLAHLRIGLILALMVLGAFDRSGRASGKLWDPDKPQSGAGACSATEYHALDFTIGDWAVSDSQGNAIGTSEIRSDLGGCVVVENWVAPGGSPMGRNMDGYNQEDKRWRRYFADTRGHAHVFEGMSNGDSIQYEGTSKGPKSEAVLNRLTIRKDGPDKMTQIWQKSSDGGKTWDPAFQGVFSRIKH
jgi:hypothetical protein